METFLVKFPCSSTRHPGVGKFVRSEGGWVLEGASRQRPGSTIPASDTRPARQGGFGVADDYAGCPSCRSDSFVRCGRCEQLGCYDNSWPNFSCPTCGITCEVLTSGIDSVSAMTGG